MTVGGLSTSECDIKEGGSVSRQWRVCNEVGSSGSELSARPTAGISLYSEGQCRRSITMFDSRQGATDCSTTVHVIEIYEGHAGRRVVDAQRLSAIEGGICAGDLGSVVAKGGLSRGV